MLDLYLPKFPNMDKKTKIESAEADIIFLETFSNSHHMKRSLCLIFRSDVLSMIKEKAEGDARPQITLSQ